MTPPKNNVERWEKEFDETFDLDFWKTFVSSAQMGRGYNLAPIHSFIRNLLITQSKAQEERIREEIDGFYIDPTIKE